MSSTSREAVRDHLVSLLSTALVGTGLPCKQVQGYTAESLAGITPLVVVAGHGTNRGPFTRQGNRPTFYFYVDIYVLQKGTSWTYAQAADALDTIEAKVADVFEENACIPAYWDSIAYEDASEVFQVTAEGDAYHWERIPVVVERVRS